MEFSICIATYNRAHTIGRTLDSLVHQSYEDFEVLVIDDGSTDNTEEVVDLFKERLKINYLKKKNGGKHTALNIGFQKAQGEFLVILDSDDTLVPDALKNMKKKWDDNVSEKDDYCGIMGRCAYSNGNIIGKPFPMEDFVSSYIDYHFGSGYSIGGYGDCPRIPCIG
jgi:glycosyltransferase involved in cell wall biosynthesis